MPTLAEIRVANTTLLEQLQTPGLEKRAADTASNYVKMFMTEEGFARKILPPEPATQDMLVPSIGHEKPVVIKHRQVRAPAAKSVPFGTLPDTIQLKGDRFEVHFWRLLSPRAIKDVDELLTYPHDLRQMFSDDAARRILAEEDGQLVQTMNSMMVGADQPQPFNRNAVMWETIPGGITRETHFASQQIMPRAPGTLQAENRIINVVTHKRYMMWGRDEMGGDWSESVLRDGWSVERFGNENLITTIKKDLVPDDTAFLTAGPSYLGAFMELRAPVMHVRCDAFMLEFFQYETIGMTLANPNAVARVDHA